MSIRWKSLALALIVGWFAGAASGLLIARFCPSLKTHKRARAHFYAELKLTPEQRVSVGAILDQSHEQLRRVFEQTKSDALALRRATRSRIRQLLTPDQQSLFDRLNARWEARFEKRFDRLQNH